MKGKLKCSGKTLGGKQPSHLERLDGGAKWLRITSPLLCAARAWSILPQPFVLRISGRLSVFLGLPFLPANSSLLPGAPGFGEGAEPFGFWGAAAAAPPTSPCLGTAWGQSPRGSCRPGGAGGLWGTSASAPGAETCGLMTRLRPRPQDRSILCHSPSLRLRPCARRCGWVSPNPHGWQHP